MAIYFNQSGKVGWPHPDFEERAGQFVTTIWRDWLTAEVLAGLNLNDRQHQALIYLKSTGRIGNSEYQKLFGVAKRTAHRDLIELVEKSILDKIGTTGKGTVYELRKGAAKGPMGSSDFSDLNGAIKSSNGPRLTNT